MRKLRDYIANHRKRRVDEVSYKIYKARKIALNEVVGLEIFFGNLLLWLFVIYLFIVYHMERRR